MLGKLPSEQFGSTITFRSRVLQSIEYILDTVSHLGRVIHGEQVAESECPGCGNALQPRGCGVVKEARGDCGASSILFKGCGELIEAFVELVELFDGFRREFSFHGRLSGY